MKNTDFMNLSLPEGADKIDVEILNSDFKKLENEASKHYIQQQIGVDGTATIIGSIGPYVQLENLTDNILNVSIGDELVVLMKGDNRKIRTITNANFGIVTSGAVKVTYYVNARTYADENFYKKEKVDELLSNVEATVEVDAELSETSENPVQNKVITAELASYATTAEVESKVTEKVAEIVAGAPERYDTLKELADWIDSHEDSAASMNSAIQKNAEDIATANTNISKNAEDITTVNARVSVLETLSDAVYKYHQSAFAEYDTGYVLRVGNQVHINLTATFHTSCAAWVGSIVKLPFKVKTPDSSTRYTLKQTQADGRETSIYLQNGSNSFFTSTAFQKGDVITIPPMILDMYVEEATTTEGGE